MTERNRDEAVRVGLDGVGPHTACALLGLWGEGKVDLSVREYRRLVRRLSDFLEELEEIRETNGI